LYFRRFIEGQQRETENIKMEGFDIIFDKIIILGLLTLVGFIAYKTKLVPAEVKVGIEKLVFNLTLPLFIFTTVSGFKYSGELLQNGLIVFILAYVFLAFQYGLGWLSSSLFRLNPKKRVVHNLHTAFGNVVFLGYPLIDTLFPGTPALFYAAVYHLSQMTLIWTFGIYKMGGNQAVGNVNKLKKLLNPNTVAFLFGFLFMVFNISLPQVINQTFTGLGSTTLYLSMIYIGMLMADFKLGWKSIGLDAVVLSLNKLLVAPILALLFLLGINHLFGNILSLPAFGAMVLQTAMPCMAILVILAKKYGSDENSAMVNVFITTLLSLFTLPLIYWMVVRFY
jgi:hypothetical protein